MKKKAQIVPKSIIRLNKLLSRDFCIPPWIDNTTFSSSARSVGRSVFFTNLKKNKPRDEILRGRKGFRDWPEWERPEISRVAVYARELKGVKTTPGLARVDFLSFSSLFVYHSYIFWKALKKSSFSIFRALSDY